MFTNQEKSREVLYLLDSLLHYILLLDAISHLQEKPGLYEIKDKCHWLDTEADQGLSMHQKCLKVPHNRVSCEHAWNKLLKKPDTHEIL